MLVLVVVLGAGAGARTATTTGAGGARTAATRSRHGVVMLFCDVVCFCVFLCDGAPKQKSC